MDVPGKSRLQTGEIIMPQRLEPAPPAFNRRKILIHTAAAGALAASVGVPRWARAQSGPMRIVVGYPPGGGTDRAARLVADRLQQLLKRTVVVENRVGAGGRLAAQQLVNTPPDQTVLLLANPAVMSVSPLIYKDLKYDVQKDYVPVAAVTDYDFGVAVGSALPVKEVQHMLAWIRANPTKANAGVPGTGSLPHFFSLMLSYMAQVNIEVVGYRGSAPLITDLIGGQIPWHLTRWTPCCRSMKAASCASWPPRASSVRRFRPRCPPSRSRACRSVRWAGTRFLPHPPRPGPRWSC